MGEEVEGEHDRREGGEKKSVGELFTWQVETEMKGASVS